jgi:hypothetical protein
MSLPVESLNRIHVPRPAVPRRKSTVVRFMEKVSIEEGGCWLWRGWVDENGYGGFRHGETNWAHRASYLLFVGPIADELVVDHLCYVELCVNPDHLEAVTQEENKRRSTGGWSECQKLHPDTPTRVGQKRTRAHCKECHRVREMNRRARIKSGAVAPHLPQVEGANA